MEGSNPENSCLGKKLNPVQPITNQTLDKIIETSSPISECTGTDEVSDDSCKASLSGADENDRFASSSDSAIGDDSLSFEKSPCSSDETTNRSMSDVVSVAPKSTELMSTLNEKSSPKQIKCTSFKDANCPQNSSKISYLIVEEPIIAGNVPCFSQKDEVIFNKVLAPAGEALAESFLTDSVLLSPSTSPVDTPRMLIQRSSSEDNIQVGNNTSNVDEACERYEDNLQKSLDGMESQNLEDKCDPTSKESTHLVASKLNEIFANELNKSERSESTLSCNDTKGISSELVEINATNKQMSSSFTVDLIPAEINSSTLNNSEFNVKFYTSNQPLNEKDIFPRDLSEERTIKPLAIETTSACNSLKANEQDISSPNEDSGFKLPEIPKLSETHTKNVNNPEVVTPPRNVEDMELIQKSLDVKKRRRSTSLFSRPRKSHVLCPNNSVGSQSQSYSLPDVRMLSRKEDKWSRINIKDFKGHRCVKTLFPENLERKSDSEHPLASSDIAEQMRENIPPTFQLNAPDKIMKDDSPDLLSTKSQSHVHGEILSSEKSKARKKLNFEPDSSCKNANASAKVEIESCQNVQDENESQILPGIFPLDTNGEHKNTFALNSNIYESSLLQDSSLTSLDVASSISKSEMEEVMETMCTEYRVSTSESSPRKRKSDRSDTESLSNIPKKTRIIEYQDNKRV